MFDLSYKSMKSPPLLIPHCLTSPPLTRTQSCAAFSGRAMGPHSAPLQGYSIVR